MYNYAIKLVSLHCINAEDNTGDDEIILWARIDGGKWRQCSEKIEIDTGETVSLPPHRFLFKEKLELQLEEIDWDPNDDLEIIEINKNNIDNGWGISSGGFLGPYEYRINWSNYTSWYQRAAKNKDNHLAQGDSFSSKAKEAVKNLSRSKGQQIKNIIKKYHDDPKANATQAAKEVNPLIKPFLGGIINEIQQRNFGSLILTYDIDLNLLPLPMWNAGPVIGLAISTDFNNPTGAFFTGGGPAYGLNVGASGQLWVGWNRNMPENVGGNTVDFIIGFDAEIGGAMCFSFDFEFPPQLQEIDYAFDMGFEVEASVGFTHTIVKNDNSTLQKNGKISGEIMDFSWNSNQIQFKRSVIQFAKESLTYDLIELEKEERFNRVAWDKCGEFGIHGWPIPARYGGQELDILTTVYALQGLGYGCKDNGLLFAMNAHIWACEMPLLSFGSEEQKEKYLPLLCRGEWIAAHAASEPEAGSDIYSLKTTAQKEGEIYILNGHKHYVTNGITADLVVVFATVNPSLGNQGITAFLVEKDTPGIVIQDAMSTMGMRTAQVGQLTLENCEVPACNRLGNEGDGATIFTHSMEWERGFILACAVGTMERLLEQSVRYAKRHKQFGQAIGKFQSVANKLVEMKMRLESAKAHLYKMAWLKKNRKIALMEAAMANLYISEAWVQSCLNAIEIHGGYGYLTETELERELRDALGSKFYSGTSDIQRVVIAKLMGL